MKYKSIAILILCASVAPTVLAQGGDDEEIGGAGTPNFIAIFLSTHKIGNSNIFQSPSGNIGIGPGAINPFLDGKLTVFDTRDVNASGVGPSSIYGVAQCKVNNFCAAVRGDVHSGFANALVGVQYVEDSQSGGGGVTGITNGTTGFTYGVFGNAQGSTGSAVGVLGIAASPEGTGVTGRATASTGTTSGVLGQTDSDEGIGVLGNRSNSVASGFGGGGVRGVTSAENNAFTYGTAGVATAATGTSVGIFGQAFSPNATAGFFANAAGGNILIGGFGQPATAVFRVDGTGRVFADGGFQPNGADFAESMAVTGDRSKYAAGDLLVIDPTASSRVALAQQPYSTLVAGIYSTKPGLLGTTRKVDESAPQNEVPLAVVGIVPCKVTAENGPIQIGDLLVSSSIPGHAMKGTDRGKMLGAVVGKALESLREGKGVIQVLVTLQ